MEKFAPAAFPWCNHPRQSSLSQDIWDDIAPGWTLTEQFAVRTPQVYLCWPRALISVSKSDDVKIFTSALHFGFGNATFTALPDIRCNFHASSQNHQPFQLRFSAIVASNACVPRQMISLMLPPLPPLKVCCFRRSNRLTMHKTA